MATYMRAPLFGKPVPQHQQDAERKRALEPPQPEPAPVELPIVAHTPQPWRQVAIAELTGGARLLERWATAQGYETAARMSGNALLVEVGLARDGVLVARFAWSRLGASGQVLASMSASTATVYAEAHARLLSHKAAKERLAQ